MTDSASAPPLLAAYRGAVQVRRARKSLTLTGAAADSSNEILLLTFIAPGAADVPDSLDAATVHALDGHRYRISSGASRDWIVQATSLHVHRDIGAGFYAAIPPRPVPLKKRLFWRGVLALAATRAGKRLLLSLRRK